MRAGPLLIDDLVGNLNPLINYWSILFFGEIHIFSPVIKTDTHSDFEMKFHEHEKLICSSLTNGKLSEKERMKEEILLVIMSKDTITQFGAVL